MKREKSRQNVTKKEEEEEKEAYWNALKEETGVLLHLVAKLQEAEVNPLFLSMQSSLLAMQRRLENVVAPLGGGGIDVGAGRGDRAGNTRFAQSVRGDTFSGAEPTGKDHSDQEQG